MSPSCSVRSRTRPTAAARASQSEQGCSIRAAPVAPVKRATFVIGPDLVVRAVVRSEANMTVHADTALAALS